MHFIPKLRQTCSSDFINATEALFLCSHHFKFMSEKTRSQKALLPGTESAAETIRNTLADTTTGSASRQTLKYCCNFWLALQPETPPELCETIDSKNATVHFDAWPLDFKEISVLWCLVLKRKPNILQST